jgi:Opioid growth factor receptor (OGFr) conserved region
MSFDELEDVHDYIQWLFPLRERSAFQPQVPVLDEQTITGFQSPGLRSRLITSARIMAGFYGFEVIERDGGYEVRRTPQFPDRSQNWLTSGNHNFLRLTRIIKSLATLGLPGLAAAWLEALKTIYAERSNIIGSDTLAFWGAAVDAR